MVKESWRNYLQQKGSWENKNVIIIKRKSINESFS